MKKADADIEILKEILESVQKPERLNGHSWASSLFVLDFLERNPGFNEKDPGEQILAALGELFRSMMPVMPPKRGVRLDPRWSEFGFLAAKYFAPILYGTPVPASFQEAWGRIDQSILLFVHGKSASELRPEDVAPYVLMGHETEITPISTISDWHRKGLSRLMDAIAARESYLSITKANQSANMDHVVRPENALLNQKAKKRKKIVRWVLWILLFFLLLLAVDALFMYRSGQAVLDDVRQLQSELHIPPQKEDILNSGPLLEKLQTDLHVFRKSAIPFVWLSPLLGWVPDYGCDVLYSRHLLDMSVYMVDASVEGYHALGPVLDVVEKDDAQVSPAELSGLLVVAEPQFSSARELIQKARTSRENVQADCLSEFTKDNVLRRVDPALSLLEDGLTLAAEFPQLVGASNEGPKTYLLLVQNEDELRPTGGFITAAATVLVENGAPGKIVFKDSGKLDDFTKPYPAAPWQLRDYMNSRILIFRDANWFTNFPTAALYAEQLYSYVNDYSVDGVIAFDQQVLVELLKVTGPIKLEKIDYPIDSNNVKEYMLVEKPPEEDQLTAPDRNDKDFLDTISAAVMKKILDGDVDWNNLVAVVIKLLNERHILLQLDNQSVASLVARRYWDGAVRPRENDFLMVVDTNIGFNKTNSLMDVSLSYSIDLTTIDAPKSQLLITHHNNADPMVPCVQWAGISLKGQRYYPVDRCYWGYERIYLHEGATLVDANPQTIPGDWMIRRRTIPAKVDILTDEEIAGISAFGFLKVIPGGRTVETKLDFSLPKNIIQADQPTGGYIYRLHIQKQPGTVAIPLLLSINFPAGSQISVLSGNGSVEPEQVLFQTDLREDRDFAVLFVP